MGRKVGLLSPCNKKETDRKGKRNKGNLTLSGFSGNEKVTYGHKKRSNALLQPLLTLNLIP